MTDLDYLLVYEPSATLRRTERRVLLPHAAGCGAVNPATVPAYIVEVPSRLGRRLDGSIVQRVLGEGLAPAAAIAAALRTLEREHEEQERRAREALARDTAEGRRPTRASIARLLDGGTHG